MAKTFAIHDANPEPQAITRLVGSGGASTIARGTPTKEGSSGAVAIMTDGEGTT